MLQQEHYLTEKPYFFNLKNSAYYQTDVLLQTNCSKGNKNVISRGYLPGVYSLKICDGYVRPH